MKARAEAWGACSLWPALAEWGNLAVGERGKLVMYFGDFQ